MIEASRCLTFVGCLFTGPLNNLKESMIQFSKPRKLVNRANPVSCRWCLFRCSRAVILRPT